MRHICCLLFVIGMIHGWRNQSGIRLNVRPTQSAGRGRSSIKIGKGFGLKEAVQTSTIPDMVEEVTQAMTRPPMRNFRSSMNLTIGIVVPFKSFGTRDYIRSITNSISALKKKDSEKSFNIHFRIDMLALTPSPVRK